MIVETPPRQEKRSHGYPEAKIQTESFLWLWNNHPETRKRFFAVTNENDNANSDAISGLRRKTRGVVAGVADSLLLMARGKYHGACFECKTPTGVQRPVQKEWQAVMESEGYFYCIYRSIEDFKEKIEWYLSL